MAHRSTATFRPRAAHSTTSPIVPRALPVPRYPHLSQSSIRGRHPQCSPAITDTRCAIPDIILGQNSHTGYSSRRSAARTRAGTCSSAGASVEEEYDRVCVCGENPSLSLRQGTRHATFYRVWFILCVTFSAATVNDHPNRSFRRTTSVGFERIHPRE